MRVLSLNRGSSSLKFALHEVAGDESLLAAGSIDRIGHDDGRARIRHPQSGVSRELRGRFVDAPSSVAGVLEAIGNLGLPAPQAVGHRVVHGGPAHAAPERVDDRLLAALRELAPLAPLHLPPALEVIEAVAAADPALPQVICFDSAFHLPMPEIARRLPLRRDLWDQGVRRYGFHGLSYESVLCALGTAGRGRLVIAHLGNGSSLAAVHDGRPIDTTMGLTPTGGCMMGTRSGDLDPGVLLHLMRRDGLGVDALDRLVNRDAGLLGVSGLSADMRTLLSERSTHEHAAEAVEMFCRSVRMHIGALAADLGGLDALAFTGGIGENSPEARTVICRGLDHLGIRIDPVRNDANASSIAADGAAAATWVVPADEERMIARHTAAVLGRAEA
jgi:acetate kinase